MRTQPLLPYRLIGMVHLLPLPGAPGYAGDRVRIIQQAVADAKTLEEAGFDAVLIENYGDVPFLRNSAEPVTIAAMTAAVQRVMDGVAIPVGVQVLRNDARSALSIAAVTGASFIRVNVHTGAMLTDQGIIEGKAGDTLRLRSSLGANVYILADVLVKHAQPLVPSDIAIVARDTVERGMADGLIVSGAGTGLSLDSGELLKTKAAVNTPVFAGSGVDAESVASILRIADGVIVGTSIKTGGITTAPVDPARARAFVQASGQ